MQGKSNVLVATATYQAGTENVAEGLDSIKKHGDLDAFVVSGTTGAVASFIKQASVYYPDALFASSSFAESDLLAQELRSNATLLPRVFVVSVLKYHYENTQLPIVKDYCSQVPPCERSDESFMGFYIGRFFSFLVTRVPYSEKVCCGGQQHSCNDLN